MLFKAFLAFFFKSYELAESRYKSSNSLGMSCSARALAWSGVCPPICPKLQAAAALTLSFSFFKASFKGLIPFAWMTPMAKVSSNAEMYPRVIIPGKASPLAYAIKSTIATAPPELQISLERSKLCLAIYRMQIAAYFLTKLSLSLSL